MQPLITTSALTKYYYRNQPGEVRAVDGVSMTVKQGEVLVIKGASGSGKTTLLSLLGCMTRPTSGSILVGTREVSKLPERFLTEMRKKTFGFIFQQFNLIKNISVLENILLPLYPEEIPMRQMKKRGADIMARLGIGNKTDEKVTNLSGGQQQRVAIARALINEPQIIMADEPTAHLDTELGKELLAILQGLSEEGKTIVIATHDPYVTEHDIIDRTLEMRDGRIMGGQE